MDPITSTYELENDTVNAFLADPDSSPIRLALHAALLEQAPGLELPTARWAIVRTSTGVYGLHDPEDADVFPWVDLKSNSWATTAQIGRVLEVLFDGVAPR